MAKYLSCLVVCILFSGASFAEDYRVSFYSSQGGKVSGYAKVLNIHCSAGQNIIKGGFEEEKNNSYLAFVDHAGNKETKIKEYETGMKFYIEIYDCSSISGTNKIKIYQKSVYLDEMEAYERKTFRKLKPSVITDKQKMYYSVVPNGNPIKTIMVSDTQFYLSIERFK